MILSKLFHFVYGFPMIYRMLLFLFLLTFLTMRFESLVHFSCSFKFLNTILLRFCHWFCVSVFNMFVMHSFCLIFVVYFLFLLACFTLRLEISSRFPWQFNILVANYSLLLCFVSYFRWYFNASFTNYAFCFLFLLYFQRSFNVLATNYLFRFCSCHIFRFHLTFHSLIIRFVSVSVVFSVIF